MNVTITHPKSRFRVTLKMWLVIRQWKSGSEITKGFSWSNAILVDVHVKMTMVWELIWHQVERHSLMIYLWQLQLESFNTRETWYHAVLGLEQSHMYIGVERHESINAGWDSYHDMWELVDSCLITWIMLLLKNGQTSSLSQWLSKCWNFDQSLMYS